MPLLHHTHILHAPQLHLLEDQISAYLDEQSVIHPALQSAIASKSLITAVNRIDKGGKPYYICTIIWQDIL